MTESKVKAKSVLWAILRAGIGFALAGFCIYKIIDKEFIQKAEQGAWENFKSSIQTASYGWIAVCFVLFGTVLLLTFFRWQFLLRVQKVHLPLKQVARLGMIGAFFNLCIPGAVGGDVLKMVYVSKHAGKRTTEAILTIMLDRVLGLYGLLFVAAFACLANFRFVMEANEAIRSATAFVGVTSVCAIAGAICVLLRETLQKIPGVNTILQFTQRKLPHAVTDKFVRLIAALELYKSRKMTLLITLLLSIIVHSLNAGALVAAGKSIHESKVSPSQYFLAAQVSNAVSSIPLSPGGLGVRDYITKGFLTSAGADGQKAAIAPLILSFVITLWYLSGGLVFIYSRVHKEENEDEDFSEDQLAGDEGLDSVQDGVS